MTTTAAAVNTATATTVTTYTTTEKKRATAGEWVQRNDRYLPDTAQGGSGEEGEDDREKNADGGGRSYVRGYAPAFESVIKKGGNDFVRGRKLNAEDVLLRDILLPPPPPPPPSSDGERGGNRSRRGELLGGDITIL